MKKYLITFFVALFFMNGCSRMSEQEILSHAQTSREQAKFADALGYYRMYLDEYPDGKDRAEVLLNAASLCGNDLKEYKAAVGLYKKFYREYPSNPDVSKAILLIGFLYSEQIKNVDSTRYYYTLFIEKYPQNEIVPSIKIELENLGKDPEKLLEERLKSKPDKVKIE